MTIALIDAIGQGRSAVVKAIFAAASSTGITVIAVANVAERTENCGREQNEYDRQLSYIIIDHRVLRRMPVVCVSDWRQLPPVLIDRLRRHGNNSFEHITGMPCLLELSCDDITSQFFYHHCDHRCVRRTTATVETGRVFVGDWRELPSVPLMSESRTSEDGDGVSENESSANDVVVLPTGDMPVDNGVMGTVNMTTWSTEEHQRHGRRHVHCIMVFRGHQRMMTQSHVTQRNSVS